MDSNTTTATAATTATATAAAMAAAMVTTATVTTATAQWLEQMVSHVTGTRVVSSKNTAGCLLYLLDWNPTVWCTILWGVVGGHFLGPNWPVWNATRGVLNRSRRIRCPRDGSP